MRLPPGAAHPALASPAGTVTVPNGGCLYSLARRYGVRAADFLDPALGNTRVAADPQHLLLAGETLTLPPTAVAFVGSSPGGTSQAPATVAPGTAAVLNSAVQPGAAMPAGAADSDGNPLTAGGAAIAFTAAAVVTAAHFGPGNPFAFARGFSDPVAGHPPPRTKRPLLRRVRMPFVPGGESGGAGGAPGVSAVGSAAETFGGLKARLATSVAGLGGSAARLLEVGSLSAARLLEPRSGASSDLQDSLDRLSKAAGAATASLAAPPATDPPEVGARMRVEKLARATELNGRVGTVKGTQADGSVLLALDGDTVAARAFAMHNICAPETPVSFAAPLAAEPPPEVGARMRVEKLARATELNGRMGTVKGTQADGSVLLALDGDTVATRAFAMHNICAPETPPLFDSVLAADATDECLNPPSDPSSTAPRVGRLTWTYNGVGMVSWSGSTRTAAAEHGAAVGWSSDEEESAVAQPVGAPPMRLFSRFAAGGAGTSVSAPAASVNGATPTAPSLAEDEKIKGAASPLDVVLKTVAAAAMIVLRARLDAQWWDVFRPAGGYRDFRRPPATADPMRWTAAVVPTSRELTAAEESEVDRKVSEQSGNKGSETEAATSQGVIFTEAA